MSTRLIELIEKLPITRVALLGDFMVDRYLYGNAERLSPEAPVPVLHYQQEQWRLGGAGSVAANLATLKARVEIFGISGTDEVQSTLRRLLSDVSVHGDGLLSDPSRVTTCKMRLVGSAQHRHPQQLLRLDFENNHPISDEFARRLLDKLAHAMPDQQMLCIEDYNKGVVTPSLCQNAIAIARQHQVPVIIDPAGSADYSKYRGATCIKLNRTETATASKLPADTPEQAAIAGERLLNGLDLEAVIVTLDKSGALLCVRDEPPQWLTTKPRQVFDVTGAGDMVLAMVAVARAAGSTWHDAVTLANIAGGLEVERFGAIPIRPEEILQELLADTHEHPGKERTLGTLLPELQRFRSSGKRIVLTNGCFDLLHLGHVKYFQFAKAQGDMLVVAVNTDNSIRRLKGAQRPVMSESDRVGVLEELESIDYLVRFDDDTPLAVIEAIKPDVLVKGADYSKEQVVGWEAVEAAGGRVAFAPLSDGHSISAVIQKIVATHR